MVMSKTDLGVAMGTAHPTTLPQITQWVRIPIRDLVIRESNESGWGNLEMEKGCRSSIFFMFQDILQLGHEFIDVLEIPINRSKAHIGNAVELIELLDDFLAHRDG